MTATRFLVRVGALLLACVWMSASAAGSDEDDDETRALMEKNFSGWAGIVFLCEYQEPDALLDRVCRNARKDVEAAARTHGVSLSLAPINSNGGATVASLMENRITLHLKLFATPDESSSIGRAVMSNVSFRVFYSNAVEAKPTRAETWAVPRLGFLSVYGAEGVAMGTRAELPGLIAGRMGAQLRDAVAAFARYSTPPKPESR